MRPVVVLAAGEVVALALPRRRLASRDNVLLARMDEVLDADTEPIADALHDVERRGDLVVFDLREVRDRHPGDVTDLGERSIERAADFLQPCADLICLYFHRCQSPALFTAPRASRAADIPQSPILRYFLI